MNKLAVIGLGKVGELLVTSSILTNAFEKIYIYNRDARIINNNKKSDAKFRNITDSLAWHNTEIIHCDSYDELPSDGYTVICIKEGYDYRYIPPKLMREVTARKDAPLMRKIADAYSKKDFTGEIFMVSNPIGPMSYLFQKYSGIETSKIHPIGTILDTARYIKSIRRHLNDLHANVKTMVVGEHGPSAVFLRSSTSVNGIPINQFSVDLNLLEKETLQEGIIEMRTLGYTNTGIVSALLKILNYIKNPNSDVMPLGIYHDNVFVELPVRKADNSWTVNWELLDKREMQLLGDSIERIFSGSKTILGYATERQQRKIIVVDDEPGEAKSLAMALQECILDDEDISSKNDIDFVVVNSGEEFIRCVSEEETGFDLAIVDQRMPGISGLDALIKAREIQPEMDCIILSGKSETNDLQRMVNYDGLRFIEKPMFKPGIPNLLDQPGFSVFKEMLARTQQKIA